MNLPRLTNIQFLAIADVAVMAYFYYYELYLPKQVSAILAILGVVLFFQQMSGGGFITLEQAIKIANDRIPDFQKSRMLDDGTYKITDAGLQYMTLTGEQNMTGPFRYLLGSRVRTFRGYHNYLLAISPTGNFLSVEERPEGWKLQDEPLLMKVTGPAKVEFLKKEGAPEQKVGELSEAH